MLGRVLGPGQHCSTLTLVLQTKEFTSILQTCYPTLAVCWTMLISYIPTYRFNITESLGNSSPCSFDPGRPAHPRQLMDLVASRESGCDPSPWGKAVWIYKYRHTGTMPADCRATERALSVSAFLVYTYPLNAMLLLLFFFFFVQKSQL